MRQSIKIFIAFFLFSFVSTLPILGHASDYTHATKTEAKKQIALTFDDGPNPKVLADLLPLLKTHAVHATFFVIGSVAEDKNNSEWLKKETAAGHEIENHSYGHDNFKKKFPEKGAAWIAQNLEKAARAITETTGRAPRFFRPPYWEITDEIARIAESHGYTVMRIAKPDINSLDYDDVDKHRSADTLTERVKKLIAGREAKGLAKHVLVFHELSLTVEALKTLIPHFKSRGYAFVRLDTLEK